MKNQTLTIKKMGINGEGIGYIDSKIAFIKGALTGEEVVAAIDEVAPRFIRGHAIKITKKSPARRPDTKHNQNYGYSLFHMNYLDQLPFKKGLIKDAIGKYTKFDPEELDVAPVVASEKTEHYRSEVGFPVVFSHGRLIFSDLSKVEHFLTSDDLYRLNDQTINHTLKAIQDIVNKYKCKDYYPRVKKGLRYIQVALYNEGLQVLFVTGKDGIKREVTAEVEALDNVAAVYYTINTSSHTDFRDKGYKRIYGPNTLTRTYHDRDYAFNVKSPVIINPDMEYQYYETIASMIDDDANVLSLYPRYGVLECDLPNTVMAVEGDQICVEEAKKNAERLGESQKTFRLGDVDEEVVYLCKKNKYDLALVQLFNDEMSEEMTESITLSRIPEVILTSKNMSTLGKAIALLEGKYEIASVKGIDMDPNTPLVTGIVKMTRNQA